MEIVFSVRLFESSYDSWHYFHRSLKVSNRFILYIVNRKFPLRISSPITQSLTHSLHFRSQKEHSLQGVYFSSLYTCNEQQMCLWLIFLPRLYQQIIMFIESLKCVHLPSSVYVFTVILIC